MFAVIISGILTILAVVAFLVARTFAPAAERARDDIPRAVPVGAGIVLLLLAAVITFFSSFTTVDANNVGIVTAFGKPVGTVQSGAHMLAPWDSVESFTTRIQVTQRLADAAKGDQGGQDCVQVNLADAAKACADMTVRYQINADDAVDLWKRYGSFDTVRDTFLRSATDNAAKIVYGQYQPQDAVSGKALPEITTKMSAELTKQLRDSGLTLVAVAPGQVHLDPSVQNRLNDILNAQTQTTIAQQNKARNEAQSQANSALTNSLTEPVLVQECIEAAKEIKPQYFNCWPGSGNNTLLNVGGK